MILDHPNYAKSFEIVHEPVFIIALIKASRPWLLSRAEQARGEKEGRLSPSRKSILIEYNLTVKLTRTWNHWLRARIYQLSFCPLSHYRFYWE